MARMDLQRGLTAKYGTTPVGVAIYTELKQEGGKKSRQHPMNVYIHQTIDIRRVVNPTMLVKIAMKFCAVPIPTEYPCFEARNMIPLHVSH